MTYCFFTLHQLHAGDFKKEDLAAALLDMICKNIVENAVNNCLISGAKHVFIVGTFAAHPRARDIIMAEFEYKKHWLAATLDTCVSMAGSLVDLV